MSGLNKTIGEQKVKITALELDKATLTVNKVTLEAGVNRCNASIEAAKRLSDLAAANGAALLAQVKAGDARLNTTLKNIDRMPAQTCGDAEAILRAGATQ